MLNLVPGQHQLFPRFDQEPEDTSSIVTRGTRYVQQTMFRGAAVNTPLVHIAKVPEMDQCTRVQASLLPRNEIPPSLVILSDTHSLQLESTRVGVVCLHNSFVELVLLSNYV